MCPDKRGPDAARNLRILKWSGPAVKSPADVHPAGLSAEGTKSRRDTRRSAHERHGPGLVGDRTDVALHAERDPARPAANVALGRLKSLMEHGASQRGGPPVENDPVVVERVVDIRRRMKKDEVREGVFSAGGLPWPMGTTAT